MLCKTFIFFDKNTIFFDNYEPNAFYSNFKEKNIAFFFAAAAPSREKRVHLNILSMSNQRRRWRIELATVERLIEQIWRLTGPIVVKVVSL